MSGMSYVFIQYLNELQKEPFEKIHNETYSHILKMMLESTNKETNKEVNKEVNLKYVHKFIEYKPDNIE